MVLRTRTLESAQRQGADGTRLGWTRTRCVCTQQKTKAALVCVLAALAALCFGTFLPTTAHAQPDRGSSGCHAWSPVFRPILAVLGAGQIEVALPAYLPSLGPRVFAHASVGEPPKTYQVTLTTSPAERFAKTSVLLVINGNAGNHLPRSRPRPVARTNGKRLYLGQDAYGFSRLSWFHRGGGITYSVAAPAFLPLSSLLRIAGSLVPAPLRRTPITTGGGHLFSACP